MSPTPPCHSWCGQANGIISCRRVSIMTVLDGYALALMQSSLSYMA
ncbi:hypothetical protein LN650_08020 [Klebsiella pneumoniae subsp. pneumoniae]|nr:hypothetical protein [Klebsiella pneumoniae subsp. pneumoniae]